MTLEELKSLLDEEGYPTVKAVEAFKDPSTYLDTDVISFCMGNDKWIFRAMLARNNHLPMRVFRDLACNTEENVRKALAQNESLPPFVFQKLAQDSAVVRWCLRRNPSTPVEVGAILSEKAFQDRSQFSKDEIKAMLTLMDEFNKVLQSSENLEDVDLYLDNNPKWASRVRQALKYLEDLDLD